MQPVVETLAHTALLIDVQVDQIEDGEHERDRRGRRGVESWAVEKPRAPFAEDAGQPQGLGGMKERQTAFEPLEWRYAAYDLLTDPRQTQHIAASTLLEPARVEEDLRARGRFAHLDAPPPEKKRAKPFQSGPSPQNHAETRLGGIG